MWRHLQEISHFHHKAPDGCGSFFGLSTRTAQQRSHRESPGENKQYDGHSKEQAPLSSLLSSKN